jgi:nucleoside-diphosphate kinase
MEERTVVLIKPDGVRRNLIGKILTRLEEEGMKIVALKMIRLSPETAKKFYEVHKERPFFSSLCEYMTSGPIVSLVVEGENAIERVRTIMGNTDPKKAEKGSLRALYGISIEENTIHGSDSPESVKRELPILFSLMEIFPR